MRRGLLLAVLAGACLLVPLDTASAAPPTLGAVTVVNIEGAGARLKGTVNPQGASTTYHFQYSTKSDYSTPVATADATLASASVPVAVQSDLSGLTPETFYYFRLVAANASGTTVGSSSSFSTTQGFGFPSGTAGSSVSATADLAGNPAVAGGSHPYDLTFRLALNKGKEFEADSHTPFPDGDVRDLHIQQPPGLLENPAAVPKCPAAQFLFPGGAHCSLLSRVGTASLRTSGDGGETLRFGLFNLVPAQGAAGQIGFSAGGTPVVIATNLSARPDGAYSMSLDAVDIPQSLDLYSLELKLWGTPWSTDHDTERGGAVNPPKEKPTDPDPHIPLAYISLPHQCSGPLSFSFGATAWQQPVKATSTPVNRASGGLGQQADMSACLFSFRPQPIGLLTDSKASSPSGYNFRITADNSNFVDPKYPADVTAKKAVVLLPEGVSINPSVGAGLGVCTPAQFAVETIGSKAGDGCPNAAKIGDFNVHTPLFEEQGTGTEEYLAGAIYLAQPDDPATPAPGAENPFDSLAAVYLVARIRDRGTLVKLAGEIRPDPVTGRLTAVFDGLPNIPYTDLNVTFRTGQRAFLVSPPSCGPAVSTIDLSPWAQNQNRDLSIHSTTPWQITSGVNRGPCPVGSPPFSPGVIAGGVNSNVNSYTPYFVHIKRQDTEQEITSYSLVLPAGITGKLAGVDECSDAAIAAARGKRGFAETASPSCPASSQVGRVVSGYGVGNSLTYATGGIYLAGPYHGAPLSLVTINPATVGPFDLGTIVIRSAFAVDEHTAQLQIDSSASDPIPHILDGIPLHLRDVRIYVDRPKFTHNPSSCAPAKLASVVTGSGARFDDPGDDSTSTSRVHFQLLNCHSLEFEPKLSIRLKGGTKRRAYPELTASFQARGPKDSNLKEIAVTIPHQEFLAQEHINAICTRVQFDNDNCPADSVYGSAVAETALLDKPLRGSIYLRSSPGRSLPDLVASLYSGTVHIILEGRIGPGHKGGIKAFFADLPDQPVDRFSMTLFGGSRGLLQNSADICQKPPFAAVKALGQSNLGAVFTTKLQGSCKSRRAGGRAR